MSSVDSHTGKKALNVSGPQIRRIRNAYCWSQPELAAKCQLAGWDVSRDIIARIECRTRWVGDFELAMLARVLGVSVQELLPAIKKAKNPSSVIQKKFSKAFITEDIVLTKPEGNPKRLPSHSRDKSR